MAAPRAPPIHLVPQLAPMLLPSLVLAPVLVLAGDPGETAEAFNRENIVGGWTFGVSTPDARVRQGGNPGAWLRNGGVVSFAPILSSTGSSAFTGDYRAAGVTSLAIDARTDAASLGAAGREFALLLRDTKGTPDPDDDDYAYALGGAIPQVGSGWKTFVFEVPSASTVPVPPGWSGGHSGDLGSFRPGVDWNDVITSVDRVEFWWAHPASVALIQTWDVGVDNAVVRSGDPLAQVRNGLGVNGLLLTATALPAVGGTFTAELDCSGHAPDLGYFLAYPFPAEGIVIAAGELLIDLASPRLLGVAAPHGGAAAVLSQGIPNDPALCGLALHVQGACGGSPGLALSNALDLIVGG